MTTTITDLDDFKALDPASKPRKPSRERSLCRRSQTSTNQCDSAISSAVSCASVASMREVFIGRGLLGRGRESCRPVAIASLRKLAKG